MCSFEGVHGAYDLILNNYGPDTFNGSVHIEVPDTFSASQLDELLRAISVKVYMEHNVILTAIGVYSINTKDENAIRMRKEVRDIVFSNEYVMQMHGFYINEEKKTMRLDVVVSFDAPDRKAVYDEITASLKKQYPEYTFQVALDTDFSES